MPIFFDFCSVGTLVSAEGAVCFLFSKLLEGLEAGANFCDGLGSIPKSPVLIKVGCNFTAVLIISSSLNSESLGMNIFTFSRFGGIIFGVALFCKNSSYSSSISAR